MKKLDDLSRIEKQTKKQPEQLEEVVQCFLDDSNVSQMMEVSKISAGRWVVVRFRYHNDWPEWRIFQ